MGYIFTAPPATAAKKNTQLRGYLGDTCTIQPNGARVCSADAAPVITPPPPVITPLPPTPASCPPCPPQMACPTPSPCPPCGASPIPTPVTPTTPVPPRVRPIARPPLAISRGGFANYGNIAAAARARAMLQGLGDDCQVYANGARVCNASGPAPAPVPMRTVCTNEPLPGPVSNAIQALPFRFNTAVPSASPTVAPLRTRRVCRQVPGQTPYTVPTAYTTSTVNPVVDNTTLPAAPVPVDSSSTSSVSSFDLSSIPTWAWYLLAGGGAYFLFFRKR